MNDSKKIAVFTLLAVIAGIIWLQRMTGQPSAKSVEVPQNNPFVDVKEVPLKLDSLTIPQIETAESPSPRKNDEPWERDPFSLK